MCVCVCVCARARARERERGKERERGTPKGRNNVVYTNNNSKSTKCMIMMSITRNSELVLGDCYGCFDCVYTHTQTVLTVARQW